MALFFVYVSPLNLHRQIDNRLNPVTDNEYLKMMVKKNCVLTKYITTRSLQTFARVEKPEYSPVFSEDGLQFKFQKKNYVAYDIEKHKNKSRIKEIFKKWNNDSPTKIENIIENARLNNLFLDVSSWVQTKGW